MKYLYRVGDDIHALEIEKTERGYRTQVLDQVIEFDVIRSQPNEITFSIGSRRITAYVARDASRRWVFINGQTFILETATTQTPARGGTGHAGSGERVLLAPMPGQVRAVMVQAGAAVERGQTLLLLEAMKMEIRIQAPRAGRIARLLVQAGETVERDQVLGEIEG